jgi:GNAT superfamily N-acetyltransferase
MIRETSREEFVSSLTTLKEDKFAKTFVAKCDMMGAWDKCMGYWIDDELAGAIVVTISKRSPKVANLQLLHTFYKHRGNGVASKLTEWGVDYAFKNMCSYFRVSAEFDAVDFYKKVGFVFVGKQKTAELSMFRLTSPNIKSNNFEPDSFVWKSMTRNGKGGCVEYYFQQRTVEDFYD